jgi:hypothetical protein
MTDHLEGPWTAVLSDGDGYAVDDLGELFADSEVEISIRRDTALPDDEGKLPGSFNGGDLIEVFGDYFGEGGEPRWAQAQAMAAGLNAAGGAA